MTDLEKGFYRGFACACAISLRNHRQDKIVEEAFECNFMSIAKMKQAGVDDYDIEILKPIVKEIERKQNWLTQTAPATDTGQHEQQ